MIVSSAMAVLPVCLSQIISSLCHLPIGTRASIIFRPVCSGWSTDFLVITHGAILSTGYFSFDLIGHSQSTGSPKAFTTLPSIASHTDTENTCPVDFTICH